MPTSELLQLRLTAIRYVARETCSFEFAAADGQVLPDTQPGAHVTVHLPNGLTRQYSLMHAGSGQTRYEVGVKHDANSRGGSKYMHEALRVGTILPVSPPHNNFPLREDAPQSVLFAGGIGITPILAMVERLSLLQRPRQLFYACRSREDASFLPELSALCNPQLHCDDEHAGRVLDVAGIVGTLPRDTHLYCCGPGPMLAAFETACANWPADQVHAEYFTAKDTANTAGGYTIELARTGKEFLIPAGKTILHVLREAGVAVTSSCEEGVCAACEAGVLSGIPDHRDSILSTKERLSNRTMMICCSGSKTDRLVLDL